MNRAQMDAQLCSRIRAEYVAPLVAFLCHEECRENGGLFEAGGGRFKKLRWERSAGLALDPARPMGIDDIAGNWDQVGDFGDSEHPGDMLEALSAFSGV